MPPHASSTQTIIFLIGNDDRLVYLLQRYMEQSKCTMITMASVPTHAEVDGPHPAAVIFSSVEQLQDAQPLVESLSAHKIPVLVCASQADEVLARELGADACLLYPLTYDLFQAALSSVYP